MASTSTYPKLAECFHALSDPIRLRVIDALVEREQSVRQLMEETGASQTRLTWHLKRLSDAGIIVGWKEGVERYYSLDTTSLHAALEILYYFKTGVRTKVIR